MPILAKDITAVLKAYTVQAYERQGTKLYNGGGRLV
jgi:hypothetical protein